MRKRAAAKSKRVPVGFCGCPPSPYLHPLKMAPRWPQEAPRGPKMVHDGLSWAKMPPSWPKMLAQDVGQMASKWPKMAPKMAQWGPKMQQHAFFAEAPRKCHHRATASMPGQLVPLDWPWFCARRATSKSVADSTISEDNGPLADFLFVCAKTHTSSARMQMWGIGPLSLPCKSKT